MNVPGYVSESRPAQPYPPLCRDVSVAAWDTVIANTQEAMASGIPADWTELSGPGDTDDALKFRGVALLPQMDLPAEETEVLRPWAITDDEAAGPTVFGTFQHTEIWLGASSEVNTYPGIVVTAEKIKLGWGVLNLRRQVDHWERTGRLLPRAIMRITGWVVPYQEPHKDSFDSGAESGPGFVTA